MLSRLRLYTAYFIVEVGLKVSTIMSRQSWRALLITQSSNEAWRGFRCPLIVPSVSLLIVMELRGGIWPAFGTALPAGLPLPKRNRCSSWDDRNWLRSAGPELLLPLAALSLLVDTFI